MPTGRVPSSTRPTRLRTTRPHTRVFESCSGVRVRRRGPRAVAGTRRYSCTDLFARPPCSRQRPPRGEASTGHRAGRRTSARAAARRARVDSSGTQPACTGHASTRARRRSSHHKDRPEQGSRRLLRHGSPLRCHQGTVPRGASRAGCKGEPGRCLSRWCDLEDGHMGTQGGSGGWPYCIGGPRHVQFRSFKQGTGEGPLCGPLAVRTEEPHAAKPPLASQQLAASAWLR